MFSRVARISRSSRLSVGSTDPTQNLNNVSESVMAASITWRLGSLEMSCVMTAALSTPADSANDSAARALRATRLDLKLA